MTISPSVERTGVEPRVCSYPPYRLSSGDDAIDLAELAGLILDPWQQLVLRHAMGERADGKWSAFEVAVILARQNGKNAILEARELAGLFVLGEELILHSAHEYRTAMEAYRRLQSCLGRLGRKINDNLFEVGGIRLKAINTNGEEGVERLDNGQRVKFVSRSKNAARGFSADCLIWDEAYALTEEQVDAQMPTLSARPNGQIWYTSSPPLDAVSGAQLFRVRRRALGGDRHLAYFDWGAAGCLDDLSVVDLDDRDLWRACNPAYGYRISEEAIERERAAMSDPGFARERLSIWPPDLSQGFRVISEADWNAGLDPQSQIHGIRAFAIAASWDRQTWSIGAAGRRRDGLMHGELVDALTAPGRVVERVARLKEKWKPCAIVVDPVSPAGSLIPDLEAAGIEVTKVGTTDAARAFGSFCDGVSGRPYVDEDSKQTVDPRDFRHIGQLELTSAVANGVKRPIGDGFAWDLKAGTSPHIVAVTNARYGFALKGHLKTPTPWVAYA